MLFIQWAHSLIKQAEGANLGPLFRLRDPAFWKVAATAQRNGDTPAQCLDRMCKKADMLDDYFAKNLGAAESINDMTRDTIDIVGQDTVSRDLHSPSIEELAEMLNVKLEDQH